MRGFLLIARDFIQGKLWKLLNETKATIRKFSYLGFRAAGGGYVGVCFQYVEQTKAGSTDR